MLLLWPELKENLSHHDIVLSYSGDEDMKPQPSLSGLPISFRQQALEGQHPFGVTKVLLHTLNLFKG